ncbi:MAG: glycoside hydrolase family 3 N-terminal domain-containing protein [SAR324 cluster bacterium]|nr:glycoside hydrolase family 3 N-terminal domain-containing protein [SAR324 cluster bacterium]
MSRSKLHLIEKKLDTKTPILIGFEGVTLTPDLAIHLEKINPIGVILFRRNITSFGQTAQLVTEIKLLLGDVLIGIDQEGGAVERLGELAIPSQFSLSKKRLVAEATKIQASLLASLGINLNFAPVLDLYDANSPVINLRAFSADPIEVANCGVESITAHLKSGVTPCPKHFPGHGRSLEDSHFSAATLQKTQEELENAELIPFQAAIDSSCPMIMSAHLWVPSLDPEYPATLSKKILGDLLRVKMGYQGLVISDCLEMAATEDSYSPAEMVRLGRLAGLDIWMSSFSLKGSLEFQLELATELKIQPNEESQKRVQAFLANLPQLQPAIPSEKDIFALYEASLIQGGEGLKFTSGIICCSLGNQNVSGVNAGQKQHPFLTRLNETTLAIKVSKAINRPADLKSLITLANAENALLLLVSSDAFLRPDWNPEDFSLESAKNSLHIALKSPLDLRLEAKNYWGLQGYNATGSKFLVNKLLGLQ